MAAAAAAIITSIAQTIGSWAAAATTAIGLAGVDGGIALAVKAATTQFVTGALSLGIMGTGIWAKVGALAATAGLTALLSPKVKNNELSNAQLSITRGSVSDRTILAGRVAVGGLMATDTMIHGYKNGLVGFVAILSGGGANGEVEKILYGDEEIYFASNGDAIGTYYGKIWLTQRNGSFSQQAAIPSWVLNSYEIPSEWTSNDRLLGCAHALVQINAADRKIKADGIKQPTFVFKSNQTPLIDPRTGTQVTTQAQWENPFVWAYSWAKSHFEASPAGKILAGMGLAAAAINIPSFAYAANFADAHNFKISAEIPLSPNEHYNNLIAIAQAGGGNITTRNGQLYCTIAAPKAVTAVLTDDDFVAPPTRKAFVTTVDRPNRLLPRYRDESNKWTVVDGTAITSNAFIEADNGITRSITYELPYAYGNNTAIGKLGALALVNAREPWQYNLPLKPQARYLCYVGDCIQLNSEKLNWVNKNLLVSEVNYSADMALTITGISETPNKYEWALGQTTTPPVYNSTIAYDGTFCPIPSIGAWEATAVNLVVSGQSKPIIRVTGASDWANAKNIAIKYRLASGSDWLGIYELPKDATSFEISAVTQNTSYIVAIAYKNQADVTGEYLELPSVTTGAETAGSATIAVNSINAIYKTLNENTRSITAGNSILEHTFTSQAKPTTIHIEIEGDLGSNTNAIISIYNGATLIRNLPQIDKVMTSTTTYKTSFFLGAIEGLTPANGLNTYTLKSNQDLTINRVQIISTEYRNA